MAGAAHGEEILASLIIFTVLHGLILLDMAVNSTAHEDVRMDTAVRFDLLEAFIHPVDAVLAANHHSFNIGSPVRIP